MSLLCVLCGKTIVQSDTPVHYGVCAGCPTDKLEDWQKEIIENSNKGYGKKSQV